MEKRSDDDRIDLPKVAFRIIGVVALLTSPVLALVALQVLPQVLPIIGVAFAAACVWLTVRIINRGERWAIRTALGIALAVPLAVLAWKYVLSPYFIKPMVNLPGGMEKVRPDRADEKAD